MELKMKEIGNSGNVIQKFMVDIKGFKEAKFKYGDS